MNIVTKTTSKSPPLFTPSESSIKASHGWTFLEFIEDKTSKTLFDPSENKETAYATAYQNLHAWSVQNIGLFHALAWDFTGLIGEQGATPLEHPEDLLQARFFPQGRISFAENMLARTKTHPKDLSIIARTAGASEDKTLSWQGLYDEVSRWEQILKQQNIGEGDRICTYLPHISEAYIILIAASNRGAIFSSVGTEMGADATIDRFKQIQPKLLITVDGYRHATNKGIKNVDIRETIAQIQSSIDSLKHTIVIPNINEDINNAPNLEALNAQTTLSSTLLKGVHPKEIKFIRREFNAPLAILFSSGSTGAPKCFVHGTGNLLLKHAIEHQLQSDVHAGEREFYHTTTSWMMFNWLAGALAQGATILIYDGNPAYPTPEAQLKFAAQYHCTHFGTAAGIIQDVWRANAVHITPETLDLTPLRALSYTGSVLSPEGFEFVHTHIKAKMSINGLCGGTDFVGCYASGNSFMPTYSGQLKGPVLGMAVEIWSAEGRPLKTGESGELVITKPFISRPLYFWGDETSAQHPQGKRFTKSYFSHFTDTDHPVWRHGDAVSALPNGQLVIEGRSDSTLNQNGVRIGSQLFYDALDHPGIKDEITDSIAINFKDAEGGDHTILCVIPAQAPDQPISPELKIKIKSLISDKIGRLCVPHEIQAVPHILKTPNGKKAEKPTKQALAGEAVQTPETYGQNKVDLFKSIGLTLRENPRYGFTGNNKKSRS